jgi:organic radical activating enzyme
MKKGYLCNEIFYSLQGEGVRKGTANVFIRFAKCNLKCNVEEHGFDCDTEFETGEWYTISQLLDAVQRVGGGRADWVILTGGEPGLQVDDALISELHQQGLMVAIETNGTKKLPHGLDWICVSPKPETQIVVWRADEVKCVLQAGQVPDASGIESEYLIVSPAFKGDTMDPEALGWCVEWVKQHPRWRLSTQDHKWWSIR